MLSSALFIILSVYLLLSLLLYFFQHRVIYYPTSTLVTTPAEIQLAYEDVELHSGDNNIIHGWYLPHDQARATLLFFHGNGGNISHRLDSLKIFHELKLNILIIDYQGYGQSTGSPSETASYDDAISAWNYLVKEKNIPADNIILFGRSLGAAVASWLATQQRPAVLILESTFTSIADMGKKLYPYLPVRLLTRYRYETRERLSDITTPVLILHSQEDEIVPFEQGQTLYSEANEPKQFIELYGGHNDGFITSGQHYVRALDHFISKHLGDIK